MRSLEVIPDGCIHKNILNFSVYNYFFYSLVSHCLKYNAYVDYDVLQVFPLSWQVQLNICIHMYLYDISYYCNDRLIQTQHSSTCPISIAQREIV